VPAELMKFDEFELDCAGFELRRSGRVIKLEKRPLELLILLAEKPGQLVTRQQIADRLWGKDVFLDTEHGVNTAVRKIRTALRDDFEQPRFIQTITGKGYRFVATVSTTEPARLRSQPSDTETSFTPPQIPILESNQSHRSNKRNRIRIAIVLAVLFALPLLSYMAWRRTHVIRSATSPQLMLAVLPFENLSGDPNQEYFSDGLTEEMIAQVGALSPDRLGVIARTTSMAYKHTSKSVRQIGEELGVDYILESSVRRDGNQLRVSAQLIRTSDQVHIWAESYDRETSNSIAIQEDLAQKVAEQIEVKLSPLYERRIASPHPINPQASEAYLRGRFFSNQFTAEGYRKAITYFQQAIDLDPSFAEAYSGLTDSYLFLVITDVLSPEDGSSKALDSARRAVSLGENVAEAHNSLANVVMNLQWNWSGAETEFKRAIELNPSYSNEHRIYAALLAAMARHREAWEQISQAMRSDPLSLPNNAEVVRSLYYARQYDQALDQGRKAMQLDPNYYRTHFWLARVYEQKKMYNEAIAESSKVLNAMPDSNLGLTELAYSLAVAGRERESREILKGLEKRSKEAFVPAYNLAVIHLALNDRDSALDYLQKAYQERDWAMFVLEVEPRLDPLRSDLRFQALVQDLNFPQAIHMSNSGSSTK
jgi:TolB-like protein/DNA-binding winged helix-turn-helix (wHTH) protein/Flp pilus assembly protein TadD